MSGSRFLEVRSRVQRLLGLGRIDGGPGLQREGSDWG